MVAIDASGANTHNVSVGILRQTPEDQLIPGTHKIPIDIEDGVDERYAAQALAAQESSLGVFRHLDDRDRVEARRVFDRKPDTDAGKFERVRDLHVFRERNMKKAAEKLN